MRPASEPPAWWLTALCVGLVIAGILAALVWALSD